MRRQGSGSPFWSRVVGLAVMATVVLLAGCSGSAAAATVAAEDVPVVPKEGEGAIVVEAIIEPARWAELGFEGAGKVSEVLVQEGQAVEAGAVLVRLDADGQKLALEEAQAALKTAELRLAQAQKANEHQVAEAQIALQIAQGRLAEVQARHPDLRQAKVALEQAARQEADAAYEYQKAVDRPWEWRFEEVQKAYTGAWQGAKDAVTVARANYDSAAAEQAAHGEVLRTLEAEVERAELALQWLQEGVDPLLAREVENARLQIARADAGLARTELVAPFSAVVTKLNVAVGELTSPGQAVVVLATLDELQARTVDLTELQVGRVAEGLIAVVTLDALPDARVTGRVASVELRSQDYRGDVTYPAIVALDEGATGLRWGMRATVEIQAE